MNGSGNDTKNITHAGSGTSNPTTQNIAYNESGTFTISADDGYKLDGANVSGTGCSISGNTLTVSDVTSTRTCNVELMSNGYKITYSTAHNCVFTGPEYVKEGETVNISVSKCNSNARFVVCCEADKLCGLGCAPLTMYLTNSQSGSFTMPAKNMNCSVVWSDPELCD